MPDPWGRRQPPATIGPVPPLPQRRALAACPAETRELLDAWARTDRIGEAAAAVIDARVHPADLHDGITRTGLSEQTLLDWLTSPNTELDRDASEFINAWRTAGLPGNPPPGGRSLPGPRPR